METARRFDADVRVAKAGVDAPVSARSLTNLVALGARFGDTLVVSAAGPQAAEAVEALRALADEGFGDGVAEAPRRARRGGRDARPPSPDAPLTAPTEPPAAGTVLTGVAASAGVAIGPAHRLGGLGDAPAEREAETAERESARLEEGISGARAALERDREVVTGRAGAADAAIFDAHLALLDDEALLDPARAAIAGGATAERAVHDAAEQVAAVYRGLDEPLLQERATDVLDVGRRVVQAITGSGPEDGGPVSGIVVADELTPADAAGLDPERVLAIATARGSTTAHAAILARALGLPGRGRPRPGCAGGDRRDDAAARRRGGNGDGGPAGRRGDRRPGAPRARRTAAGGGPRARASSPR